MFTSEAAKSLYQSPRWGAIAGKVSFRKSKALSIPAIGGNRDTMNLHLTQYRINPRDGGNRVILTQQHHTEYINPRNGG